MTTTLVQVARLYYEENCSQQQIADQIGVSRSLIALYLKMARQQGIVRIEVRDPAERYEPLTVRLGKASRPTRICPVPGSHTSPELTRRAVGSAVARFLDDQLHDGDVLGFGWGRAVMEVVGLLAPSKPRRIEVVPLIGESSYTGSYTELNEIILRAARSFSGDAFFLLAPMLVDSRKLRDALLRDKGVREVADRWDRLEVACVGIGALPPAPGQIVYIGEKNAARYQEQGAVGDICARYFTSQGDCLESSPYAWLLGISPEQLRKAKCVVAVATGLQKQRAILAVLRTGLLTDLFVDEELGDAILAEAG
ncbi:MAG: sugar-binding domain-containing protein [Anaerolineales bacterium]